MPRLTDRQADAILRKSQPIGCLHERHPTLCHAAVLEYKGGHWAMMMGAFQRLEAKTKIRLWNGTVVEAI